MSLVATFLSMSLHTSPPPTVSFPGKARHSRLWLVSLVGALLLLTVVPVRASRLDYLRVQPITPFHVMTHGARFDLGFEWEDDFRDSGGGGGAGDQNWALLETLVVGMDSYFFHPLLVEMVGDVGFDLRQEWFEPDGSASGTIRNNSVLYDLDLYFLQQKPVHGSVSVGSNVVQTNASFFRSQRYQNDYQRAALNYWNRLFPLDLTYSRIQSRSEGTASLDSDEDILALEVRNETKHAASQLHVQRETRSQPEGGLDATTNTANFSNILRAGGSRYFLLTQANWSEQQGSQSIRMSRLGEDLTLHHTTSLETNYSYLFDKINRGSFTRANATSPTIAQAQQSGLDEHVTYKARLTHRLYASVATNLFVEKNKERLDAGFQDVTSGGFNISYRKRIGVGTIAIGYGMSKLRNTQDLSGTTIAIQGERHTFGESPEGGRVVTLGHDLIDAATITIADADGFPILDPLTGAEISEGLHYQIEQVGSVTRIRLLAPDGLFLLGREVFVSYTFQPLPPVKIDTLARSYNLGWEVGNIWRMYYEAMRSDQRLREGEALGRLDNIKDRRYGADLHWGVSTTRVER